jgi:membrane associated rhomboid family serine protease
MLALYWFGQILAEYLGEKKLLYTYLYGGIAGAVLYILFFNLFPVFSAALPVSEAMGASAAVMAIVFATATLLPDYSLRLLFFGNVSLKYIAFIYLLIDILSIGSFNSGGHIAHIGGAIFGFILIKQLRKGNDWIKSTDKYVQKIFSLFRKKNKLRVSYINKDAKKNDATADQKTVDAILDKISKNGYDNLSKQEKEILFKASKDQ